MKWLLVYLSFFAVLAKGSPQTDQPVPKPVAPPSGAVLAGDSYSGTPKIEFDRETYDFGRLLAGSVVKYDFIFTNAGNATLVISNVLPSCECTVAGEWTREVAPGKTGVIPVQVRPPTMSGSIAKSVAIISNDTNRPSVVLNIQGTLYQLVEVIPQNVFFHLTGDSLTNESMSVRITNNLSEPITLSGVEISDKSFSAELRTIQAGKEFKLTVTAMPPYSEGKKNAVVEIKTSSASVPVIKVPVFAIVHPMLVVTPMQVPVPSGPLQLPLSCTVSIHNNSAQLMEVAEPVCGLRGVELGMKEVGSPRFQMRDITDLSGFATKLQRRADPISAFLWTQLDTEIQNRLTGKPLPNVPRSPLRDVLIQFLNRLLDSQTLNEKIRFDGVQLRPATKFLLENRPRGGDLANLNRLLLEDAYPQELSRVSALGHHFELTVTFPKGFVLADQKNAEITIKTSRLQDPVIRVPIVADTGGQERTSVQGGILNGSAN